MTLRTVFVNPFHVIPIGRAGGSMSLQNAPDDLELADIVGIGAQSRPPVPLPPVWDRTAEGK